MRQKRYTRQANDKPWFSIWREDYNCLGKRDCQQVGRSATLIAARFVICWHCTIDLKELPSRYKLEWCRIHVKFEGGDYPVSAYYHASTCRVHCKTLLSGQVPSPTSSTCELRHRWPVRHLVLDPCVIARAFTWRSANMNRQDDKLMFEMRELNRKLPTFAWHNEEAFAFSINMQLFVSELTTMLSKTENWKIFKCIELVPDSERMMICDWKQSSYCFRLPCFEEPFHRIVLRC